MNITIYFKDGSKKVWEGWDNAIERKEGWVTVYDKYDQQHSFPSDSISEVVSVPRPRW